MSDSDNHQIDETPPKCKFSPGDKVRFKGDGSSPYKVPTMIVLKILTKNRIHYVSGGSFSPPRWVTEKNAYPRNVHCQWYDPKKNDFPTAYFREEDLDLAEPLPITSDIQSKGLAMS